jgi:hypothetical protein
MGNQPADLEYREYADAARAKTGELDEFIEKSGVGHRLGVLGPSQGADASFDASSRL